MFFFFRHRVMPRDHLYLPKESSFPIPSTYNDVVRQTKPNWTLWKRTISVIHGTLMDIEFFLKVGSDSRDSAS